MASRRAAHLGFVLTATAALMAACGQKGAPLAPLHLVPAAVSELSARLVADRARLRFVLPSRNENGPGRLELDRVEIYAMTIPANSVEPSPRELMAKERLVGGIAVRPVLEEGEVAAPGEKRPEPGSAVTFDEELTAAKLTPEKVEVPPEPAAPPAPSGRGAVAAAPAPPAAAPAAGQEPATPAPAAAPAQKPGTLPFPRRIYVVRGVTRAGRPGGLSPRLSIPLVPLPPPPKKVTASFTETTVNVAWEAEIAAVAYNVYRGEDVMEPVNRAPVTTLIFEQPVGKPGEEQCFRIRSVGVAVPVSLEGEPSAAQCVTPRDQFAPAAPRGLAVVPTAGQISLIWDANTEKDLAGYIVLRGEGPDGALAAITAAPIKETSYRDTTVKPGTSYVYAVVAVDTAAPPNMSAQSARVQETAR
jgi:hypothetical protein